MKSMAVNDKRKIFVISFSLLAFLYPLLSPYRIKHIAEIHIGQIGISNELWLLPLLLILKIVIINPNKKIHKSDLVFLCLLIIYAMYSLLRIIDASAYDQCLYAIIEFFVPIVFIFFIAYDDIKYIDTLLKIFTLICLVYSLLVLYLCTNYNTIAVLIDNLTLSGTQFRIRMMLGSSITVSYYFNITLPLLFYGFYRNISKEWNIIFLAAIIMNVVATLLLLSRTAMICAGIVCIYYVLISNKKKKSIKRRMGLILVGLISISYILSYYDITRLFVGFSDESTSLRAMSTSLGYYIFKMNPIIGSGMGAHFVRYWEDAWISVDGFYGLVDPHNVYILILSEGGILGFLLFITIIIFLNSKITRIRDSQLAICGKIMLLICLLTQMGGSQIYNEPSFAFIFWIYMGMFFSLYKVQSFQDNIIKT